MNGGGTHVSRNVWNEVMTASPVASVTRGTSSWSRPTRLRAPRRAAISSSPLSSPLSSPPSAGRGPPPPGAAPSASGSTVLREPPAAAAAAGAGRMSSTLAEGDDGRPIEDDSIMRGEERPSMLRLLCGRGRLLSQGKGRVAVASAGQMSCDASGRARRIAGRLGARSASSRSLAPPANEDEQAPGPPVLPPASL